LSIDAAVYTINWTNIQQTINLPTCGFYFTTNVGDAKVYGSELEMRALVTPTLTLSLNAGTTHAYIPGGYLIIPHPWPGQNPPPGDGGTRDDYAV